MKWGWFTSKSRAKEDSLEDPENLANLLVALYGKRDTTVLIAFLADERVRLLLCKALVSPVSGSDRKLAQRALHILRFLGMDPEQLKKRLEPAAFALGLVSARDVQIDYYDVLGVKPSATPAELRVAYRKKAFELHPDTARGKKEESTGFVTLQAAYDTLMNPKSREAFDQCRVRLGMWREQRPGENPSEGAKRRPAGKFRKTSYRIAAVVVVMVVIAWVLTILYETETMLELVQITSSTEPGPALEMRGPDPGEVGNKASVLSEVIEDKAMPKPVPKKPVLKKPIPKKLVPKKPVQKKPVPNKLIQGSLKTVGLAASEAVEAREPVEAQARVSPEPFEEKKPSLDVKTEDKGASEKPKEAPAPESVELKELPLAEPEKKQALVVRESRKKELKDVLKPAKKERVIEKPVESLVQAKAPAVSEDLAPPNSSIHVVTDSPVHVFPDIPVPKAHKTPFIKRSQVLAFLKQYTTAYERGNAETFFSYFTANAMENGKPLKAVKPEYLEIWGKVQSLDYRISLKELEQIVGSDTLSMKGRFDLDWEFSDGQSGQSHGEIFMDLKLNKSALRISRVDYRFDGG